MAETVFDGVLFMMRERGVKVVSLVFISVHICVSGENVFCEANHNCKFFFYPVLHISVLGFWFRLWLKHKGKRTLGNLTAG